MNRKSPQGDLKQESYRKVALRPGLLWARGHHGHDDGQEQGGPDEHGDAGRDGLDHDDQGVHLVPGEGVTILGTGLMGTA